MNVYMESVMEGVAAGLTCSAVLALFFALSWDTPVVQMAYPTMECRQVLGADPQYNCGNLPKTYIVEWVSPRNPR